AASTVRKRSRLPRLRPAGAAGRHGGGTRGVTSRTGTPVLGRRFDMSRRMLALTSGGVLLAAIAASITGTSTRAIAAPSAPVFTHPVWVDAQRDAGEPDITIGHDGRLYVSAPWGVSTDTSFIWRSEDGG